MFDNGVEVEVKEVPLDVDFGDMDHQKMTHEWACRGMKWLYRERKSAFADMMIAVVGIDAHVTNRTK